MINIYNKRNWKYELDIIERRCSLTMSCTNEIFWVDTTHCVAHAKNQCVSNKDIVLTVHLLYVRRRRSSDIKKKFHCCNVAQQLAILKYLTLSCMQIGAV